MSYRIRLRPHIVGTFLFAGLVISLSLVMAFVMEEHPAMIIDRRSRLRSISQSFIAAAAISGGALVILGARLSWFSLFAGLQPYRGADVLNGRLFAGCGALSVLAGVAFL